MTGLREGNRSVTENRYFSERVSDETFQHRVFRRVGASAGTTFKDVNFSYMIFEDCYFRKCRFEDCNFTGAKFRDSNFDGAVFANCNFSYSEFYNTRFDEDILEWASNRTNLKREFARRLRLNFRDMGEIELENRAASLELHTTQKFLFEAWFDNDHNGYFRQKFKGRKRVWKFIEWLWHIFLYFIWGNGESFLRLFRTVLIAILLTFALSYFGQVDETVGILELLIKSPAIFFGGYNDLIAGWTVAIILFFRLTLFGFLLSMLVKKWSLR